jgi:hypothetical protein
MRPHGPVTYAGLATATKRLIAELGGLEAAASVTRVRPPQLSDYGSPHVAQYMPADVIADLETVAGRPLLTEALARLQGYALLPLSPRGPDDLALHLARIGQGVGVLFGRVSEALLDGTIDAGERQDILSALTVVHRVVGEALGALSPPLPMRGTQMRDVA